MSEQDNDVPKSVSPGILYRQHFKLNASQNEDETIRELAKLLNISEEKLRANIKEAQEINKAEYLAVQAFTAPYKTLLDSTPKITKDKYDELMDVGRFLLKTGLNIRFSPPSQLPVYPDFTFAMDNDRIGIEHSRIIDEQMKRATKTTQKLLEDAAKIVNQNNRTLDGIVNIFIDFNAPAISNKSLNSRGFTAEEREQLKEIIANYVTKLLKMENNSKPPFIIQSSFERNPGHPVSINLGERYFAIGGFRSLAEKRIAAKEKRFSAYQSESGLTRIWLLLIVDGFSSHSGFDLHNEIFLYNNHSEFELILVFEVFSGKHYLIYDKSRHGNPDHIILS